MLCLYCHNTTKVIDSRESAAATRRRRQCLSCDRRFTTYERAEVPEVTVIKKSGKKEPYDTSKIIQGLQKACSGRDISMETIEQMAQAVEQQVRDMNTKTVESNTIGDFVMQELKNRDKVAYARFASVYQEFEDLVTVKE